MHAGRFTSSRSHLEAVLALYDPNAHHALAASAQNPLEVGSTCAFGDRPFLPRFPDQALAQSRVAIAEAQQLAHPRSLIPCHKLNSQQRAEPRSADKVLPVKIKASLRWW